MNAMGYAFNAWLPLLTYPQTASPKFTKGWIWSCVAFTLQIALAWAVNWLWKRELRNKAQDGLREHESETVSTV